METMEMRQFAMSVPAFTPWNVKNLDALTKTNGISRTSMVVIVERRVPETSTVLGMKIPTSSARNPMLRLY